MVAEMETCSSLSGYSQVGGEGSIFKGVKSINCCEDNATQSFNLDDASWCTGSEGTSMESDSDTDTNTDSGGADVITSESHTESVEESHTEEHSESHLEESHTESSSTATTTTTDGGSNAGAVGLTYSYAVVTVLVSAVVGGLSL